MLTDELRKVAVLLALPLTDFLAASFAWELFKEHAPRTMNLLRFCSY